MAVAHLHTQTVKSEKLAPVLKLVKFLSVWYLSKHSPGQMADGHVHVLQ